MPTLKIPAPLRPYAGGQSVLSVSGDHVSDILQTTADQYPELKKHLFSEEGELRPFVNIFLDEENIKNLIT